MRRQPEPLRRSIQQIDKGEASVMHVKPSDTFVEATITREAGGGLSGPTTTAPPSGGFLSSHCHERLVGIQKRFL